MRLDFISAFNNFFHYVGVLKVTFMCQFCISYNRKLYCWGGAWSWV